MYSNCDYIQIEGHGKSPALCDRTLLRRITANSWRRTNMNLGRLSPDLCRFCCRGGPTAQSLWLHSCGKFGSVAPLRKGGGGTRTPDSHLFSCLRDFPINYPKGDVYEERDRFEGGCRGSRDRTCRLYGSETPPGGSRGPQVAGRQTAIRCAVRKAIC